MEASGDNKELTQQEPISGVESEKLMSVAKKEAKKLIDTMPDTASWDDVMYAMYVRAKIMDGLEDGEAGRAVSQEEVEKRFCQP